MKTPIKNGTSYLLLISAVLLIISIFIPIWRIELDAPQYPEGLAMKIYSYKLGGDVEIINGLNHYIGMATLHSENFIEFTILPYLIGFFAILFAFTSFRKSKSLLIFSFLLFLIFGIVSMIDFWRWEYEYGHNLDPNAAIIVPGMAYQPPLIGFKQLLNFGAFSVPDIGGWFFIISGILILICIGIEFNILSRIKLSRNVNILLLILSISFLLISCSEKKSDPIKLNKDMCDFCKMTISDGKFGAEIITQKGRIYKFDDISCMHNYMMENGSKEFESFFVCDYSGNNELINVETTYFVKDDELRSPMGGNIAAFRSDKEAVAHINNGSGALKWNEIKNILSK